MSEGLAAFGTLLKLGDGGTPETFTAIAEVTDLTPPELTAETADVTHHESPNSWREVVPTVLDGGEVGLSINYLPADASHDASTGLLYLLSSKTLRNWQVIFPDVGTTTWSFAAYVTKFASKAPVDDKLSAEVTLKVTGQPTLE